MNKTRLQKEDILASRSVELKTVILEVIAFRIVAKLKTEYNHLVHQFFCFHSTHIAWLGISVSVTCRVLIVLYLDE